MKRLLIAPLAVLCLSTSLWAAPTLGGAVAPDGKTQVMIDVPMAMRAENRSGIDGSGLCVFTSIMHAARWQKEPPLEDFQTLMRREFGGGWPERVDRMIAKYAPGVDYLQYEGRDPIVIQAALKGKRLPCVTYSGRDPHYKGWIAHMVNVVHYDERWVAILDNNYIDTYVWMTPAEFLERWRGKGSGWVVVLLKEPPERVVAARPSPGQTTGGNPPVRYVWYYHRGDPYRVYLYCEEEYLVGAYDFKECYFRYYAADEDRWLSKCRPPFPPPVVAPFRPSGPVGEARDHGIPLDLFPPRTEREERWTRQGTCANKAELLLLLEPRKKPDPPAADPEGLALGSALVMMFATMTLCLFGKERRP